MSSLLYNMCCTVTSQVLCGQICGGDLKGIMIIVVVRFTFRMFFKFC